MLAADPWAPTPFGDARPALGAGIDSRSQTRWDRGLTDRRGIVGALILGSLGPSVRLLDRTTGTERAVAVALIVVVATVAALTASWREPRRNAAVSGVMVIAGVAAAMAIGHGQDALVAAATAAVVAFALTRRSDALAVPFAVAGGWSWAHSGSLWLTVALLSAAAAIGILIERSPTLQRVNGSIGRALDRATGWIPTAIVLLVALIVLYLPAAIAAVARWIAHGSDLHRAPSWEQISVTRAELRRDATRSFATTPAPVRRRRVLISLLVAAVGLALAAASWSTPPPLDGGGRSPSENPSNFLDLSSPIGKI